jgi:hypothetical protein
MIKIEIDFFLFLFYSILIVVYFLFMRGKEEASPFERRNAPLFDDDNSF